ncbi:MAG: restriction endonuclease, partial [Bacteroidota bacterium]
MKYNCINIQGNLISEEILQKIENAEAIGQQPKDFGFEPGTNLRNEIEYAWSRVKLDWKYFSEKSEKLPSSDPYGTTLSRRWMEKFLTSLGFRVALAKGSLLGSNNQTYKISHVGDSNDQLPIHIVGFIEPTHPEKNTLDIRSSGGTSRMSPHATIQEYLNVSEHIFGLTTNGLSLRLIRDSGRLIKLTYIEFDLKRMLEEDKYSEFTVLYRLLHATRFPAQKTEADQCLLETYYQESIEVGNRIRDGLSFAVQEALEQLGSGFLRHPKNATLREKLASGKLSPKDYFRQLLRIVYRLLFLMVTEERDLIYNPDDKSESTARFKAIYLQYYSILRLRKLSENRYLHENQFNDLWQGLVSTFQLFELGSKGKKMGIEPLAGELFSTSAIADLDNIQISNKVLLQAINKLNEFREKKTHNLVHVNYRSLDVEELGSVYEGLLELHPIIENLQAQNTEDVIFTFHEGTDRKTTGSYYTRPDLVNELIKSALIPVIEQRLKANANNKEARIKALLGLKVCDAAAGSGHMILAAARTIAWYLAREISGEENPAPSLYRQCLRDAIQHCVYAVDMNPDAVELCKLALWLEGHNSGKPLSFLDHKIRCGNSLVGVADLKVLKEGIPSDAYKTVTMDDKKVCAEIKSTNTKFLKKRQGTLDFDQVSEKGSLQQIAAEYKELDGIDQDNVQAVEQARRQFEKIRKHPGWYNDWTACN